MRAQGDGDLGDTTPIHPGHKEVQAVPVDLVALFGGGAELVETLPAGELLVEVSLPLAASPLTEPLLEGAEPSPWLQAS